MLSAIQSQALQPQRIIIVVNQFSGVLLQLQWEATKNLPKSMYEKINRKVIAKKPGGRDDASYARNLWLKEVTSDYMYIIDDDNIFAQDFFARTIAEYLTLKQEYKQDIVFSPTIMWRDTERIQSQWIKAYHFLLWWPEPVIFSGWKSKIVAAFRFVFRLPIFYKSTADYVRVCTIGWNSLFWPKEYFLQNQFDERMWFIYEDIDCFFRMTKKGIPLLVSKKTAIQHMERDKTILEHSFLATPAWARNKAKNRILFVKKNATTLQKIWFRCLWFPVTSFMTVLFLLVRWGNIRYKLLYNYIEWIKQWIKLQKSS